MLRVRAGVTMIELVLTLVVVGVVSGIMIPRAGMVLDRAETSGARTMVAELVAKARFAAVSRSGPAMLTITPDGHLWVTAPKVGTPGVQDTVGRIETLGGRYGVAVVAPQTTATIGFDAQGVGTDAGSTLVILNRNNVTDSLAISASGRTSP